MRSIEILDIKDFMQLLLQSSAFDPYEFISGEIRTDMLYTLDGHLNKDFFSEEELSAMGAGSSGYLSWSMAKHKVFLLIKGKRTPSSMKIVLRFPEQMIQAELSHAGSSLHANDIDGIYANIVFHEQKLNVICGISYKIFTMGKNLEDYFSSKLVTLFKSFSIACQ